MSKEQRRAIDAMLRKVPQTFKPLPVEQMREGFAKMMSRFPVSDEVTQTPIELAGRPAVLVQPKLRCARGRFSISTVGRSRSVRHRPQ